MYGLLGFLYEQKKGMEEKLLTNIIIIIKCTNLR